MLTDLNDDIQWQVNGHGKHPAARMGSNKAVSNETEKKKTKKAKAKTGKMQTQQINQPNSKSSAGNMSLTHAVAHALEDTSSPFSYERKRST
jgi:hypothetical protein